MWFTKQAKEHAAKVAEMLKEIEEKITKKELKVKKIPKEE